jgi:hypothetical protein
MPSKVYRGSPTHRRCYSMDRQIRRHARPPGCDRRIGVFEDDRDFRGILFNAFSTDSARRKSIQPDTKLSHRLRPVVLYLSNPLGGNTGKIPGMERPMSSIFGDCHDLLSRFPKITGIFSPDPVFIYSRTPWPTPLPRAKTLYRLGAS